ncbi:MAG TPA: hypothetical protein VE869_00630 [Gemmatimonas sp.]|nr:hypothetical protein [Gemmatimonas sp.]
MADSTTPFPRRQPRRELRAGRIAIASLVLFAACEKPSVRWLDDAPLSTSQPSPLLGGVASPSDSALADSSAMAAFLSTQDLLREAGANGMVRSHLDSTPAASESLAASAVMQMTPMGPAPTSTLGNGDAPIDPARCARSLRFAEAPGRGRVAVWWSRRDRGRVTLLAAWRDAATSDTSSAATPVDSTLASGVSAPGVQASQWRGPIIVDSLDQGPGDAQAGDRGSIGCARVAPSVVIDDRHGYVHVAYALVGPEGPGVFYAHQMDPRSAFEPPQAIVYGARLGAARVAASGDVVAVAYEDPNSGARARVAVAISRTSGHMFTDRLTASADNANALDPFVAVRGRAVVLGWSDIPATGDTTFRIRRARVE